MANTTFLVKTTFSTRTTFATFFSVGSVQRDRCIGYSEGGCPRHREKYRRGGARLQQLQSYRPRGHGVRREGGRHVKKIERSFKLETPCTVFH